MKTWFNAMLFLLLISFQVATIAADGPSGTIDRSSTRDIVIVPRSGSPIVMTVKYGQAFQDLNVSDYLKSDLLYSAPLATHPPGTYYLTPSVTFTEAKDSYKTLYTFSCDGVGQYNLQALITATNPSNKWRETFYSFQLLGSPNNFVESWDNTLSAKAYINRGGVAPNVPFYLLFTTKSTGILQVVVEGHSIITDVNNDKIVNIVDVSLIAAHYGLVLTGRTVPNYLYDMDCNLVIDIVDMSLVALDFGFHVPP